MCVCAFSFAQCCNCAMRSCPFSVTMQIMCRSFHASFAVPCTNVTIQHGLKYAAWMEQDKTSVSKNIHKCHSFSDISNFFFLRLLWASSIKDDTHAACWATSLNECSAWLFVWPRALVYQFGTHLKCFCSFKTSVLVSLPAAVVKSNVFNDKIVAVN